MKKLFLPVILLLTITSCASIVSKSQYQVSIASNPDNAKFTIANKYGAKLHSGKTPAYITLSASDGFFKKAQYTITYEKRGYNTQQYNLTSSLDGWYFGNILIGGLIGILIVDPITGAMYKLPEVVNVSLSSNTVSNNTHLKLIDINTLTQGQKSKLVRIN